MSTPEHTPCRPSELVERRRCLALAAGFAASAWCLPARAHHGWSSFDLNRPLWLSGKARKVQWRNPHVELELETDADLRIPGDLAARPVPAQVAQVEGARLLAAAQLPTRRDRIWQVELAPLTRMQSWQVPEIQAGSSLGVVGFSFAGERGDAVLRAEYLFLGGKAYGLRSSPA